MGRNDERRFFDRLVELRDAYGRLGPDDTTVTMSTAEALEWLSVPLDETALESEADAGWG